VLSGLGLRLGGTPPCLPVFRSLVGLVYVLVVVVCWFSLGCLYLGCLHNLATFRPSVALVS